MNEYEKVCKECEEVFEPKELGQTKCKHCRKTERLKLMQHLHEEAMKGRG